MGERWQGKGGALMSRAEDHVWRRYRKEKDDVEMNFVKLGTLLQLCAGCERPSRGKGNESQATVVRRQSVCQS